MKPQIGCILSLFLAVFAGGCASIATYQMSGPSPQLSTKELSDALAEESAKLTLQDGKIIKGKITDVLADSIRIHLDKSNKALTVTRGEIQSIFVSKARWWVAGALAGLAVGSAVGYDTYQLTQGQGKFPGVSLAFYPIAGAVFGAALVRTYMPDEEYIFAQVPDLRDAPREEKKDVLAHAVR
jgi:hypothetical protein